MRVGQSVDTVGKAGDPKSIAGGHVQATPVLLCAGEKAELVSDQYESLSSVLEGFVILREKVVTSFFILIGFLIYDLIYKSF